MGECGGHWRGCWGGGASGSSGGNLFILLVRLYYSEITLRPQLRAPAHKVEGWLRVRGLTKACNKVLTHDITFFLFLGGVGNYKSNSYQVDIKQTFSLS